MQKTKISNSKLYFPPIILGTWSFGGDKWWGKQCDKDSCEVLEQSIDKGINVIDTAPVYGRGRSERIIGAFIRKRKLREDVILATKLGLNWQGSDIFHDLNKKRMLKEIDESRSRLETDYFDLYQVHWPDPDVPIGQTAELMHEFFQKKIIKAIGVSNYNCKQMEEFMKYAPLHCLQPEYSMFKRNIEKDVVDYCIKRNISIITYAPLYSGLLTGKFFFNEAKVPDDLNRKFKQKDLTEPGFSINKATLGELKVIADGYQKSLAQLAINWNFSRKGIISAIVGIRNLSQFKDNLGALGWEISNEDIEKINQILKSRELKLNSLEK